MSWQVQLLWGRGETCPSYFMTGQEWVKAINFIKDIFYLQIDKIYLLVLS